MKQLQLERPRLIEGHQLQVERLKKSHSDFWLRWNSERGFKEKLQSSRSKILNKDLALEELRLLYEKQHREELLALDEKFRFELRVFDLRLPLPNFEINTKWYFKIHFFDPDSKLHNGRPESENELRGEANGQLFTSVSVDLSRIFLLLLGREDTSQVVGS